MIAHSGKNSLCMAVKFLQNHKMISQIGVLPSAIFIAMTAWLLGTDSLSAQAKKEPAKPPAAPPAAPPAKPAPATEEKPKDLGPLNMEEAMQAVYQEAYQNFNLGKYEVTLQKLAIIRSKMNNKDVEQVMFLEGASLYMLEKYDKAAATLKSFIEKFPTSESRVDANINMGRALLKLEDGAKGIAVLLNAATVFPDRKGEIGLALASHHKEKGNMIEAQRVLESITANARLSPEMVQAFLMLAELYAANGETDKAGLIMEKLKGSSADDDTVIQRNLLGLRIGDEMREKKLFNEALVAYQNVRKQSEILRIQKSRIARIEQLLADSTEGKPVVFLNKPINKGDIESMLEANKTILADIEKNKNFDADLYYRLGQCFYEMQRYYEAIAALKEVYTKFPEYANRDIALFSMILCYQKLEREGLAYELCDKYLKDYPDGQFSANVSDLFGMLAFKSGRINDAVRALQRARESAKDAEAKERITFLLGVVLFEAQKFDDSRDAFKSLIMDNPKSINKDDAEYRIALTYFFQNDSVKAKKAFQTYLDGNPQGLYRVDVIYRLAFITYQQAATNQGGDMNKAREMMEKLADENPNDDNIGQVWSLLGDIYSRMQNTEKENYTIKAMMAYMMAVDKAKSEDVEDYAFDAATGILTTEGKWQELANMAQTYYTRHKNDPKALKAIYIISNAYRRMGKSDEAQALMAEHIAPNLGNPKNEQVEMLIQQLVGMIVPKKRSRSSTATPKPVEAPPAAEKNATDKSPASEKPADTAGAAAKTAEATTDAKPADVNAAPAAPPAPAPAQTFEELEERLKTLLTGPGGPDSITNGTAQARVLYARALLARMMRDLPKYESLLSVIPDAVKPEELSPLLLATIGDMMLARGELDKAAVYYGRLREVFSGSEFGDKAPVGLGKIEFVKKNYSGALELFTEAIEKFEGSSSLLDATLGKAQSLLELGKLDEAEKLYKTIAATREWKGEPTANSLFHLGVIEQRRKAWGKAIAYFQRVILAHQKYKNWLAKSHLHCAQCQIEDGKKEHAVIVLRQMLARTDLQEQPEFKEAQSLLAKAGN